MSYIPDTIQPGDPAPVPSPKPLKAEDLPAPSKPTNNAIAPVLVGAICAIVIVGFIVVGAVSIFAPQVPLTGLSIAFGGIVTVAGMVATYFKADTAVKKADEIHIVMNSRFSEAVELSSQRAAYEATLIARAEEKGRAEALAAITADRIAVATAHVPEGAVYTGNAEPGQPVVALNPSAPTPVTLIIAEGEAVPVEVIAQEDDPIPVAMIERKAKELAKEIVKEQQEEQTSKAQEEEGN